MCGAKANSQAALARILGIGQSLVARLEGGKYKPNFATLTRQLALQLHLHITPTAIELTV